MRLLSVERIGINFFRATLRDEQDTKIELTNDRLSSLRKSVVVIMAEFAAHQPYWHALEVFDALETDILNANGPVAIWRSKP